MLVAAALLLGSAPATARSGTARLTLTKAAPLTVRGTAFRRHERVRVVLRQAGRAAVTHRVRAGRRGRFTTAFGAVSVGHCGGFTITATGARGSQAKLVRFQPACMPV